jgi:hypothetical protein
MAASKDDRFVILRRLAVVEASLRRLPFLPVADGIGSLRDELTRERTALMGKLDYRA